MKAYTDIEQSKKLAEILPLESADMHYNNGSYRGVDYTEHFSAELMPYQEALHLMEIHKTNFMFQVIPCWSLAALYAILPNNKNESTTLSRGGWKIEPIEYLDNWWCVYEDNGDWTKEFSVSADNPIDACYEMIIKLHELNMLSITHD